MRGKIFYHGACFDGATSAALFAAFYRERHPGAEIVYQPMAHSAKDPFRAVVLDGDDNICVDFRYCPDPRMNWWFDHHVSAFQPRELREHFEANQSDKKVFDPDARSCAILLHQVLEARFDFALTDPCWRELVHWADKIDGADFSDPREAVELHAPALQIATWLAHTSDTERIEALINSLGRRPLAEIAGDPAMVIDLAPVLADNQRVIDLIGERAISDGGVVFYDLIDDGVAVHNKFIAYLLFPTARYTVGVTRSAREVKISVGNNPWASEPRTHNIAELCERYGGGGHPVVGAVAIGANEVARGREIAAELCAILRSQ